MGWTFSYSEAERRASKTPPPSLVLNSAHYIHTCHAYILTYMLTCLALLQSVTWTDPTLQLYLLLARRPLPCPTEGDKHSYIQHPFGVYGGDAELRIIPHPDERAGGRKNRRVERGSRAVLGVRARWCVATDDRSRSQLHQDVRSWSQLGGQR